MVRSQPGPVEATRRGALAGFHRPRGKRAGWILADSIHIIENDEAVAGQLARALARFGVQARRSGDGNEGVRRALNDRPAAVLLGLMDDKGAGYALCSKLRRKSREIPVIMIVDAAEQGGSRLAEHRGLGTAADAYLQRPFSVRALHDTLVSVMGVQLPLRGDPDESIGQPGEDAVFDGLFEGEEDADIEAATEKWFDAIMSHDSAPPSHQPPRVTHAHQPSIEELEINLDELVPPAEDEVLATLRRENANLRDRVAELEAARAERPSRATAPASTANRRELLEMRQRLTDRERELVELRDRYSHSEGEAIELEEALEDLRRTAEALEKRLEDAEGRARREASAHEEAEAHVQRLRQQLAEARQGFDGAERARADAEEELVPLRAELEGLKKARDEVQRTLDEARQALTEAEKRAAERLADLGAEVDDARGALAAAKQAHADSDAAFQAEISSLKASHADDLQTMEQLQEEAAAEALAERERRNQESAAALEARHAEMVASLTDRAEVAERSLAEKDKALTEYRLALSEAEVMVQRSRQTAEINDKKLGEQASRLDELEALTTEQAAQIETLEEANSQLTTDLERSEKTVVARERAMVEARSARQASEARLESALARMAGRETAVEKVRAALDLAYTFLERASGDLEPRSDPAREPARDPVLAPAEA